MWFLMLWTWWMSLQALPFANGTNGTNGTTGTPLVDTPYDTGPVEEYAGPPR
jgi:hypothetical protein